MNKKAVVVIMAIVCVSLVGVGIIAANTLFGRANLAPLAPPDLQAKVTIVELKPARRVVNSVSKPEGSPWCNGRPTYWLTGHDNTPETPWCQQEDGSWTQPGIATLDKIDELNAAVGHNRIDRHGCATVDFNGNNRMDLVCVVGAQKGGGQGFNEVYVTEPDGSLRKVEQDHGLHKFPGMRTRDAVALDAADGGQLLFISTQGAPRDDGKPNAHRLFRLGSINEDDVTRPYFHEVDPNGPWALEFRVSFVLAADINHNGISDLIVGDMDGPTRFFLQSEDLSWQGIDLDDIDGLHSKWANVRVADVTGDGVKDLIAVGPSRPSRRWLTAPYLRIYAGNPDQPFLFDFENPVYEYHPPFEAVDVSLVDANKDGVHDLYLVQNDRSRGKYCAPGFKSLDWWERSAQPPAEFVPPTDSAQDILLVGSEDAPDYTPFRLEHALPGCGGLVERWNNHSLILAKGNFVQPGYNVLLEW